MADIETLGIVDEIQALVSDKLQVVSYKWLSRNFLVSSNSAKRLLQEFVEKHGSGLEVVYSLSGWLKDSPSTYHIRLVSSANLAEAKKEFSDDCSVQVYSVQACIPKDPVALWNSEFVQAEELFRQSLSADNCLLDNRFCGISNPFITRNGGGTIPSTNAVPQMKSEASGLRKSNSTAQVKPEQKKVQLPSPSASVPSSHVVDAKSESRGTSGPEEGSKFVADKHKVVQLPPAKKAVQSEKSSKNGGALANMWGRVPTKPKVDIVSAATSDAIPNPVGNAAQICTPEGVEDRISDDDDQQVSIRRTSNGEGNRKRRVIFDYSDEEDEFKDAVNLASPDPPKQKSILGSKQTPSTPELEKREVKKVKEAGSKSHEQETKEAGSKSHEQETFSKKSHEQETFSKRSHEQERKPLPTSEPKSSKLHSSEIISEHASLKNATVKDEVTNAAPTSPKRRKVMNTRIDERGREVTEVVWEGEDTEIQADSNTMKKADNNPVNSTGDRAPMAKKSPALGSTAPTNQASKAGNKKTGNKDPKQGNILSFFKKKA
ncbi:sister chromatid cohesion protein PDS5 homolog C isoform X1 [Solanum stenotomum]|uniref:sister chromatid cohesion protein PDS5 homolog C isoform X1 n=1 Tax=Solanum stenotomum TaxID=172797 RepID=UPI0020D1EF0A|nr:sister chromatid cohesion protein PDS5 homolog C isoform X1 [Solanum stenotomum]